MGTSLTVHPFAALASMVPEFCPRVLINLDRVGDFGSRPDDVVLLGKTDEVVREIAKELGWEGELDALWKETEGSVVDMSAPQAKTSETEAEAEEDDADETGESTKLSEEETLKAEVDKLTEEVERILNVSAALATPEESQLEAEGKEKGNSAETVAVKEEKASPEDKEASGKL